MGNTVFPLLESHRSVFDQFVLTLFVELEVVIADKPSHMPHD